MKTLLMVDLQNDFIEGGALAVEGGSKLIELANRLQTSFDLVVASQDWHPANHKSFASQHRGKSPGDVIQLHGVDQVLWPDHCVQQTKGAEFHPDLDLKSIDHIVQKGMSPKVDSYSAFFDNDKKSATGLADYLMGEGADELFIMGLALDFCVLFTALDAARLGFQTHVIVDACRAVNLAPGDDQKAMDQMQKAGVKLMKLKDFGL